MSYVYFAQQGLGGAIKIGYSTRPASRLGQLRTSSSQPIRLLCLISGSLSDERELHERFASDRLSGEWFRPSAELIELAEALMAARGVQLPTAPERGDLDEFTARARTWASEVEDMIARRSGFDVQTARRELAEKLGLPPGYLENLRRGRCSSITAADYEKIRASYLDCVETELAAVKLQLTEVMAQPD